MSWATRRGLLLAAGLILGWLGSWVLLLPSSLSHIPPIGVLLAIFARTELQTGLFIVAHDAMHGTLWPSRPIANRRIGQIALWLYAALPYGPCRDNHALHHRYSGTLQDPDHHGEGSSGVVGWFQRFMAAYLSPAQLTALVLSWLVLADIAASVSTSSLANVVLYGALPVLLSSLQLFLVGTYLPHRSLGPVHPESSAEHHPRSLDLPVWLSLLACFHFGYHWEHHAFPHLAWHELPAARRCVKEGCGTDAHSRFPYQGDNVSLSKRCHPSSADNGPLHRDRMDTAGTVDRQRGF